MQMWLTNFNNTRQAIEQEVSEEKRAILYFRSAYCKRLQRAHLRAQAQIKVWTHSQSRVLPNWNNTAAHRNVCNIVIII